MIVRMRRLATSSSRYSAAFWRGAGTRLCEKLLVRPPCSNLVLGSSAMALGMFAWGSKPDSIRCSESTASTVNVLHVEGMSCNGCRGGVQRALEAVPGVTSVIVDLEEKLAHVKGVAEVADLIAAVRKSGKQADFVATVHNEGFREMMVAELKAALLKSGQRGIVLDIDETLSATNAAWFSRLAELFGNPEGLSIKALIEKYHLAQNVPCWQSEEALAWMQRQRDDPKAQEGLPLVPGSLEGVHQLAKIVPIVGYCTVRPTSVNASTMAWLHERGFPDVPVVAKPLEVPFADGNKWKAAALHELWPEVMGIVDDNPKVPSFAGKQYSGSILLYSHSETQPAYDFAIPCRTWADVVLGAIALVRKQHES